VSYLILGNDALTQIKQNVKNVVLRAKCTLGAIKSVPGKIGNQPPKNNKAVIKLIIIIWAYSAKKNNANVKPEYSVLKPETSSLSPSAWSKGALFVSANAETKNISPAGNNGTINQQSSCASTILLKFKSPAQTTTAKIISPIHTS